MMARSALAALSLALCLAGCGAAPPLLANAASARAAIAHALDDWHDAAARGDEERYFGHLAPDAIFLGTDATERWTKDAFRTYAHPHFARGHAWVFHATRRAVTMDSTGRLAWFDEDLATEGLGPARGSGVMRLEAGVWRIVQYNLAITVPNERFGEVRALLAPSAPPAPR